MVVSNGIENADAAERALALRVSLAFAKTYAHVHHIASAQDMATACQTITGTSILLWFDFCKRSHPEDVEKIKDSNSHPTSTFKRTRSDHHVRRRLCAVASEDLEEFEYEEHDIKDESGDLRRVLTASRRVQADCIVDRARAGTVESPLDFEREPRPGIVPDGTLDQAVALLA